MKKLLWGLSAIVLLAGACSAEEVEEPEAAATATTPAVEEPEAAATATTPAVEDRPTPTPSPPEAPEFTAEIAEQEVVNAGTPLEAVRVSIIAPSSPRRQARACGLEIDNPNGGVCWAFPSREAFETDPACWDFMAVRDEPGGDVTVSRGNSQLHELLGCPQADG